MTSVVARATVVVKLGAENGRYRLIFNEVRMLAVGVVGRERSRCNVLSHPDGIAGAAVEDGGCGEGGAEVVGWTGEAVLKEAIGVDWRSYVLQWAGIRGHWR